MLKYLQSLNADKNNKQINRIDMKLMEVFCLDKNADILM